MTANAAPLAAAAHRRAPRLSVGALRARRISAGELERRIATAGRRLEVVVERFNEARDDLQTTVARLRDLDRRLGPLSRELDGRGRRLGALMAETYRRTPDGPMIAMLGSGTPQQFMDRLLVLGRLATAQNEALAGLTAARGRVAAARAALNALAERQRRQQRQLGTIRAIVGGEIGALRQLRAMAYGVRSRYDEQAGPDRVAPPYSGGAAGGAVAFAYRQLGKPYRWGAAGPDAYDCSGLTSAAWARAGVRLPHNANRQFTATAHLGAADLRPGDLVFYYGRISHVAIYVGDGKVIHAPEFGEDVRIDRYDFQPVHGFSRPS